MSTLRRPARPNMSPVERELDLRTNLEVRAAILAMVHVGVERTEVARMFGRDYSYVSNLLAGTRPERLRQTTGWRRAHAPACEVCGSRPQNEHHKSLTAFGNVAAAPYVCQGCRGVDHGSRIDVLRAHAERTGFVPTLREAQAMLGIGRSVAGDELLRAFGPDHRDGYTRRVEPRPYVPQDGAA